MNVSTGTAALPLAEESLPEEHQNVKEKHEKKRKMARSRSVKLQEQAQKRSGGSNKRQARYKTTFEKLEKKGYGVVTIALARDFLANMLQGEAKASLRKRQKIDPTAVTDPNKIQPNLDDVVADAIILNVMKLSIDDFVRLIKGIKLEKRTISAAKVTFGEMTEDGVEDVVSTDIVAHHLVHIAMGQQQEENSVNLLKEMHKRITSFDKDNSGTITFPEFWELTRSQRHIMRSELNAKVWDLEREYHNNRPSSLHYLYDIFDTTRKGHYEGQELFHLASAIRQYVDQNKLNNKSNYLTSSDMNVAQKVINDVDEDGNQQLEYTEFHNWLIGSITKQNKDQRTADFLQFEYGLAQDILDLNTHLMQKELRSFYTKYDADKNGQVNAKELLTWMSDVHETMGSKSLRPTLEIAKRTIEFLDQDKNGTIEENEIFDWMRQGQQILFDEEKKDTFLNSSGDIGMAQTMLDFLEGVILMAAKSSSRDIEEIQKKYDEEYAALQKQADAALNIQACQRGKKDRQGISMNNPKHFITATFVANERLGLKLNHECEVNLILRDSQACKIVGLSKGDLLVKINDQIVRGLTLVEVKLELSKAARPMTCIFERHTDWVRNPNNGLPSMCTDKLTLMFRKHECEGGGVEAGEFAEFMVEVHNLAMEKQGRTPKDDANFSSLVLAQRLIDAHDQDDDGNLELEELLDWINDGLSKSQEERDAYRARGGYCPASSDFLEDIAHSFHKDVEGKIEEKSTESDAAVAIQAVQRGRAERRELQKHEDAATKIQAIQRGKNLRGNTSINTNDIPETPENKLLQEDYDDNDDDNEEDQDQDQDEEQQRQQRQRQQQQRQRQQQQQQQRQRKRRKQCKRSN